MQAQIDELKKHIEQLSIVLATMVEKEFKQSQTVEKLKQEVEKLNDANKSRINPYCSGHATQSGTTQSRPSAY